MASLLRLNAMRRITIVVLAVSTLLAVACGADTATTTTGQPTTSTSSTTPSTTTTLAPTSTTVPPATTTTTPPGPTTSTLPGSPIDFGPRDGDVLMVIGVGYDDVLNLRAAPGADQPILERIPPTFTNLVARGNTRDLGTSLWIEATYESVAGWVHLGYVGYQGEVSDQTSVVVAELDGLPVEDTMTDLAEVVAGVFASEKPESDVVQVTPVTSGDLTEVTYDVIGLGDDAVRGVRLHIFAEETVDGLILKSVEMTAICGRGVDQGDCV